MTTEEREALLGIAGTLIGVMDRIAEALNRIAATMEDRLYAEIETEPEDDDGDLTIERTFSDAGEGDRDAQRAAIRVALGKP